MAPGPCNSDNVDQTHWVSIHVYFFCQTRTKINRLCKFYRQEVCKCLKLAHFEVTCIYLNSRSGETSLLSLRNFRLLH